ncbi:hypothetical protein [uncultured Pseudoalteromonas sp.]|uniref:hypothetical protein n=1 Tax=uncultured Pseudoalteromonas sp. TaxID=114053 RepID=UPI00259A08AB|nr:hypothetical protein [uncultured Pseudoalteromonas sp.]
MFLVETRVLSKEGRSNTNWRQLSLLTNNTETKFELREYYGQKKIAFAKEVDRLEFDDIGVALLNFNNGVKSREIDGYSQVEALFEKATNVPFVSFKPPAYRCDFNTPFTEQLALMDSPVAVPIHGGRRLYIRFGHESLSSIMVLDCRGDTVELADSVKISVLSKVKIGQIENGVIECYEKNGVLCIYDVCSINGLAIEKPYVERLAIAKDIFGKKSSFTYPEIISADDSLRSNSGRYFLIKSNAPFDTYKTCRVIPNFYSVNALLLGRHHCKPNTYKVFFTTEDGYKEIGFLTHEHEQLHVGTRIQIAFSDVEDSNPVGFWLSPIQPQGKECYDELGAEASQMDRLNEFWLGL